MNNSARGKRDSMVEESTFLLRTELHEYAYINLTVIFLDYFYFFLFTARAMTKYNALLLRIFECGLTRQWADLSSNCYCSNFTNCSRPQAAKLTANSTRPSSKHVSTVQSAWHVLVIWSIKEFSTDSQKVPSLAVVRPLYVALVHSLSLQLTFWDILEGKTN